MRTAFLSWPSLRWPVERISTVTAAVTRYLGISRLNFEANLENVFVACLSL